MKNRAVTLLSLLAANDRFGQPEVHRTVLVKQAFLAETLHPLYRLWRQTFSFVRYRYGPYSEDIFFRLDTLIFNGLVEVTAAEWHHRRLEARYRISEAGHRILGQVEATELIDLANDLVWALQALGIEQAGTICKLVYQEAEFARIFAEQTKAGIGPEAKVAVPSVTDRENASFVAIATLDQLHHEMRSGTSEAERYSIPSREIVRQYLESLIMQLPRHRMGVPAQ